MNENCTTLVRSFQNSILAAIILLLVPVSCVNRRDRIDHERLIPEKEFATILYDIYLGSGLLSLPDIRDKFSGRDSTKNYIDIIESYGYSYESYNNTMNYYFTSKPKKLIKIYDRMTARMSSLESSIQNEVLRIEEDAARRSARFNIYYLPDADSAENPQLTLKIDPPGYYTLTYYITIYPDDMSGNPQLTAWLTDADSIESGMKKWLPAIKYLKDGHHYLIRYEGHVSGSRPMIMNSILYSYGNEMKAFEKHARIEVVSFNFTQQPE